MTDTAAAPDRPLRKLPGLDPDNRAFWTGGAEDRLMIDQCADCSFYTHPPLPRCRNCGSTRVTPTAVSGRGRVASFTINQQAWLPGLAVPYAVAVVELAEQPELYLFTNIVNCPVEDVRSGLDVAVVFERDEHIFLPMFEPAGAAR